MQTHSLNNDPYLTVEELAAVTRRSVKTVYEWRLKGTAPTATKIGRQLLFRQSAVELWLKAHERAA
jgi:excisionase family DNA binding protein